MLWKRWPLWMKIGISALVAMLILLVIGFTIPPQRVLKDFPSINFVGEPQGGTVKLQVLDQNLVVDTELGESLEELAIKFATAANKAYIIAEASGTDSHHKRTLYIIVLHRQRSYVASFLRNQSITKT